MSATRNARMHRRATHENRHPMHAWRPALNVIRFEVTPTYVWPIFSCSIHRFGLNSSASGPQIDGNLVATRTRVSYKLGGPSQALTCCTPTRRFGKLYLSGWGFRRQPRPSWS